METLTGFFKTLTNMSWTDYLDIILVAYVIYLVLQLVRSSSAMRIAKSVMVILVVYWLTDLMDLYTLNFLISQVLTVGIIALVVLFQPELRRMLDHMGSTSLRALLGGEKPVEQMDTIITQTVLACEAMSRDRIGALMVFARNQRLDDYIKTGTVIEGRVSEQLIRNIFFPKAALHDGAMMIRDGQITAAGCVLPLSESSRLSADLGTRHRAGVGMSEASDAVVVIVSEETGTISVAVGGMLKRHLAPQTLERLLRQELVRQEPAAQPQNQWEALRQRILDNGLLGGKEKNHEK